MAQKEVDLYSIVKELSIKPGRRRDTILKELEKDSIEYKVQDYEFGNNIIVDFNKGDGKIKAFSAHYDVYPGSPGANDNGAAVAELIGFAKRINDNVSAVTNNVRIMFFDNEELLLKKDKKGESLNKKVGSLFYTSQLSKDEKNNIELYNLDLTGIGNTIILASDDYLNCPSERLNKKIKEFLRSERKRYALVSCITSDEWSFRKEGIEATVILTLPLKEVAEYRENFIHPPAWDMIHTKEDNIEKIEEKTLYMVTDLLYKFVTDKRYKS